MSPARARSNSPRRARHVRFGARCDPVVRSPRRARHPRVARGRRRALLRVGQRTPRCSRCRVSRGPPSATTRSPSRARCRATAPIVFDIACSVAARGHILLAAREGRAIPEGWALDEHGRPTTDASRRLRGRCCRWADTRDRHRDDGRVPGGRARRDLRFAGARGARARPEKPAPWDGKADFCGWCSHGAFADTQFFGSLYVRNGPVVSRAAATPRGYRVRAATGSKL